MSSGRNLPPAAINSASARKAFRKQQSFAKWQLFIVSGRHKITRKRFPFGYLVTLPRDVRGVYSPLAFVQGVGFDSLRSAIRVKGDHSLIAVDPLVTDLRTDKSMIENYLCEPVTRSGVLIRDDDFLAIKFECFELNGTKKRGQATLIGFDYHPEFAEFDRSPDTASSPTMELAPTELDQAKKSGTPQSQLNAQPASECVGNGPNATAAIAS